jgi:CBS domain-containing protein
MAKQSSISELRVRDIMQSDVRTVARNDTLSLADELMKEGTLRHLPVIDEWNRVCAVLSQRDIFRGALLRALGYGGRAEERTLKTLVVKETMSSELYAIEPDATISAAAHEMLTHKVGCLPVIDDNELVGIVTETDLIKLLANDTD